MAKVIDPRAMEFFEDALNRLGLAGYHVTYHKLPKKLHKVAWAKVKPFHDNKEVDLWVGPTKGMPDDELQVVMAHEASHCLSSLLRRGQLGDIIDEQFSNMMARLLYPGSPRVVREANYKWETVDVAMASKPMPDELRELLLEEMPHLVVRLPERDRAVILALFYDYRSLRDVADQYNVDQKTVRRWRDAAIEGIRTLLLTEEGDVDGTD